MSDTDRKATRERRGKPVRTASGVAPVAVLTKPFPCPGRCVFCPNDVRMPKSYLSMEPGAQRATRNAFDPFAQTWNRLLALHRNGHSLAKIELIVMGGTFSAYPSTYQRWFVTRCLDAMNEFDARVEAIEPVAPPPTADDFADLDGEIDGRNERDRYDARVASRLRSQLRGKLLAGDEHATEQRLTESQRTNETSAVRCVGLSVETRPDRIDLREVTALRRLGATKVQLGYQSLDDAILSRNRRGCGVDDSRRATALLRRAGFKVQAHWMPNLVGATPASDRDDARRLFADPDFRPDELKIYPCVLIESAELMAFFERGEWTPYGNDELVSLIADVLAEVPRWCRVSRVIRDIPAHDIVAGSKRSNLREVVEHEIARRGRRIAEIRSRQISRVPDAAEAIEWRRSDYPLSGGDEVFLEASTGRDELLGFLRLHLPAGEAFLPDLEGAALVREVHVYGRVAALNERGRDFTQHRGIGRSLLERAESIARERGLRRVAVISAVGTREYYRKLGYLDGDLYLVKALGGLEATALT